MKAIVSMLALSLGATLSLASPVVAQSAQEPSTQSPAGERVQPGRLNRSGQAQRDRRPAAPPAPPTPEQNLSEATALAAQAAIGCQVTEVARSPLVTAEQAAVFEVACASGPGYILIASTPPRATDCVLLAGQADITRRADPAAQVGIQCTLPVNTDVGRVVAQYAQEAGVPCTVDQGASIGRSSANNLVYEVGCQGADGYWLERVADRWEVTPCLQVLAQNGTCRFTTPQDQAASIQTLLATSEARDCRVTQARFMGSNPNGTFYEAACEGGTGYIARVDAQMAVQQIYPCAEASRIGGGCTLTAVAPADTTAAPASDS